MKTTCLLIFTAVFCAPLIAQENQRPARLPARPAAPASLRGTNASGGFAADLGVVHDAQAQALEQARQMLKEGENLRDRTALGTAIKEMERAQAALAEAKKSPEKLPAALAAEQAAYQALLKVTPREYRMTRAQRGSQSGSQSQSQQRQMNQLEMPPEENRYETERQAAAPQNAQQREQLQTADRLKELAQRQQDLNARLRELQTALQAARTEPERAEVQRQLKRLRDEQRQMLASVDELRQQVAESPNASSQAETRQQLDETRSDMERAAQEMERQSASQALAAGTRAQQGMQNLREELRRQTSSQFSEQMRQLRQDARELAGQEEQIARGLEALNNAGHQSLNDAAPRQEIARQLVRQQGSLTNLLAKMKNVTEQAETTEPLLAQKLYDTLRRADQMHTDNLLQMGTQLVERGFLPQASQVERSARTNILELAQSVERAAESVLGSEAEALRYAQKELDELARQMEREMGGLGTNSIAGAKGRSAGSDSPPAGNNSPGQPPGEENSARAGSAGRRGEPANGAGNSGEPASGEGQPGGQGQAAGGNSPGGGGRGQPAGANGRNGEPTPGERQPEGPGQAAAGNNGGGNRTGQSQAGNNSSGQPGSSPPAGPGGQAQNGGGGNGGGGESLRRFAEQLGRGDPAGDNGGPITGNGFVNWSDRLRDVEQVLDSPDLRNQLATVRERTATLRGEFRDRGQKPPGEAVREQILAPLSQVRVWVQEELMRRQKSDSLVPLDRDPVPEVYSELVRKYYEKLGSAQ